MGGSSWSASGYSSRQSLRAATNTPAFAYDAKMSVADPSLRKIHPDMDPKGIKNFRESRDSDAHPESVPVAVFFDQTGSMGEKPKIFQKELGKLMGFLLNKGGVAHPQILFGAIGDAIPIGSEIAPFQVGQFESGLEMDDDLGKFYLEGCGGAQSKESYDLAFYFLARKTSCDAFEKRNKKGYAFIILDEGARDVQKDVVEHVFGDKIESDIRIQDIVNEALEKWNIFIVKFPYSYDTTTQWKNLLPERVLETKDPYAVCGIIAGTIAMMEGSDKDDVVSDLASNGIKVDTSALTVVSKTAGSVAKVEGNLVQTGGSSFRL